MGSRVSHATARIANGARGVTTFASASFCKDRPAPEHYAHASMPDVEPAASLSRAAASRASRGMRGVLRARRRALLRSDQAVLRPAKEARIAAWVRLREPAPLDAPLAALLLDALPPAVSATFGVPRPLASVDFTIHFFARLRERGRAATDEHQLVTIRSRWADDGYTEELRELWSPRGAAARAVPPAHRAALRLQAARENRWGLRASPERQASASRRAAAQAPPAAASSARASSRRACRGGP